MGISLPLSSVSPSVGAEAAVDFEPGPARLRGVLWRRVTAYLVDAVIIAVLYGLAFVLLSPLWLISLGALSAPLLAALSLVPLAYHTLLIGGTRSATFGQRLFGLEVRSIDGGSPSYFQALVQTALFYVTVGLTTCLILLVACFNRRRRTLHDMLAGTLTLRRAAGPEILPPGSVT